MRLIIAPHDLGIGGSQINAIDLAAGVADAGHDVTVFGVPGPLVEYIERKGLPFVAAHPLPYRPAATRIAQMLRLSRRHRIDLIHAYEWPPCLDAYFGAHLVDRVPILCTVLGMFVSPFVPSPLPLVMGTNSLADEARAMRDGPVWTIEPPIDTDADHPSVDGSVFRRRHHVLPDELLVVTVSRLAIDLKLTRLCTPLTPSTVWQTGIRCGSSS